MAKMIILFACVTFGLFRTIKSARFECNFSVTLSWATFDNVYYCNVCNSVNISSRDAAQIDSVYGVHNAGYNNDNVEAITVTVEQIHYFPHGLDIIFKNLKGISIGRTGLKEVHKSDMKAFPNLKIIYLFSSNLEILEENLFEFNLNLEAIHLHSNKISHTDSNVFDKLTKLKSLNLQSNTCINMNTDNNPTQVQNIIKAAKSQCTSSDYSKLEQKVENLKIESKNLNSEKFNDKLENLKNEVKNSKFPNFFQDKIESMFKVRASQIEKAQREVLVKIVKIDEKLTAVNEEILNLKQDVSIIKNAQPANIQKLDRIQNLVEDQSQKIATKLTTIDGKLVDVKAEILKNERKIEELNQHITKADEATLKFNKDTTTTLKDIESSNSQNFAAIMSFIENLGKKMEAIEDKLADIDSTQKKVMSKIHKIESDSHDNKMEINQKLKAILNGA